MSGVLGRAAGDGRGRLESGIGARQQGEEAEHPPDGGRQGVVGEVEGGPYSGVRVADGGQGCQPVALAQFVGLLSQAPCRSLVEEP
ncbi:hypothetical protein [Streptomyces sp. 1222.5]|uniref:hypothetical protein n=1 Tax=Streptomyces sp. 1222.5 TaxID=1881026 RepID=UPI003F4A3511